MLYNTSPAKICKAVFSVVRKESGVDTISKENLTLSVVVSGANAPYFITVSGNSPSRNLTCHASSHVGTNS
jgi:hypothetical protein